MARTLHAAAELEPRWKRCVGYVDNDLGEALGQVYVRRNFSPDAKERAQKMVNQIEDGYGAGHRVALLDDAGHQAVGAGETRHAVANKIGYPDKWRDYSALDDRARR